MTSQYILPLSNLAVIVMAVGLLPAQIRRRKWVQAYFLGVVALLNGAMLIVLIGGMAQSGCYPWAPRLVEFHQGMTLCPGQSATAHVPLTDDELNSVRPGPQSRKGDI